MFAGFYKILEKSIAIDPESIGIAPEAVSI